MTCTNFRFIFPIIALLAAPIVHAQRSEISVPPELGTEVLLILTYDEMALNGTETKGQIGRIERHNNQVRKANISIDKAVSKYPYPYAMARRSDYYGKNMDAIPPHRFVIDSPIMEGFQNNDQVRADIDIGSTTVYVSEVYLWDIVSKQRYTIFGATIPGRQVDRFQDILRFMTNRYKNLKDK